MAKPCVVFCCENIGTHRFPRDETRKIQWIQAIQHIKPSITLSTNSLICSAHFCQSDFAITPAYWSDKLRARKFLKKTATPSVVFWNKASRQLGSESQKPSSNQDSLCFDSTKVKATYARVPRIAFAEEQYFMDTPPSDLLEDPLQWREKTATPSVFFWNKASRQLGSESQKPLSNQDSLIFDSTKVKSTYARVPRIAFAEEQYFMDTPPSDLLEDPLQCSDHESESFQ